MKFIFFIACLFPILAQAQDCKVLRETDPYTKETKLSSGFITVQGGTVSIDADKTELDFFFVIPNKCFNDMSTVFVFFEGSKSKQTYRSAGSMNCEGYFHFKFKNAATTPTAVQKFTTQKITQFIFTDSDKKQVILSLMPDQQDVFMKTSACLAEEAKKLIK